MNKLRRKSRGKRVAIDVAELIRATISCKLDSAQFHIPAPVFFVTCIIKLAHHETLM